MRSTTHPGVPRGAAACKEWAFTVGLFHTLPAPHLHIRQTLAVTYTNFRCFLIVRPDVFTYPGDSLEWQQHGWQRAWEQRDTTGHRNGPPLACRR